MKQWYVKELSKLSGVSVRTLHYYDKTGLLKPSIRQSNQYRLYSMQDLLKLQQIIALKFFGFNLAQIKELISDKDSILENFSLQEKLLKEKAASLVKASEILNKIIKNSDSHSSLPWQEIIKSIEVYKMTKELEHAWVKEIFNEQELKEYAEFEAEMKVNASEKDQKNFEENWHQLVDKIKNNIDKDPNSDFGAVIGERCMSLINGIYGKKYAHLRTKKLERGFGEGKGLDDVGLTPESVSWLEKALDAYWHQRIYQLLSQVGKQSDGVLLRDWQQVMDEMYGNEESRKAEIIPVVLADDNISKLAKDWIRLNFN